MADEAKNMVKDDVTGEMMSKNERASRFGSSLLPLDESEARRGETCAPKFLSRGKERARRGAKHI